MDDIATRLGTALDRHPALAIAVSGGVDSLTLATFAHRRSASDISVYHAVSPAVPQEATERIRSLAAQEGWALTITGAGEFEDRRYRDNPHDRCYFCKSNLYDRIRTLTVDPIASGANCDDLGDYRPGLIAAAQRDVVHPMIEAGLTKADVRCLSADLGLGEIAELPAQPCLSSRVETGIAIDAADLAFIEATERELARLAGNRATLRCRITRAGVVVEIGEDAIPFAEVIGAEAVARTEAAQRVYAGLRAYRRGSMFVLP